MNPNLTAALALAARGIRVFPCMPSKRPQMGVPWKTAASSDARTLDAWWRRWPDSVPALEPGSQLIAMLVVDCDRKPGAPDGVLAFQELCLANGDDARDYPTVETPSTGRHVFFLNPDGLGNSTGNLPKGIDVRGKGGYVIAENAVFPDGRGYTAPSGYSGLMDSLDALPNIPAWLTNILTADKKELRGEAHPLLTHSPGSGHENPATFSNIGNRERAAFQAGLDAEVRNVRLAGEGTRNSTLNTAAFCLFQMVASGWGSSSEVEAALTAAALEGGLNSVETRKTISSGRTAGIAQPRPKLADREPLPMVQIQFERTTEGDLIDATTGEIIEEAEQSHELDDRLTYVPGLLGEIVEFIVASARYPNRRLALGAALPLLGTLIGRRMASPTGAATHLYVITTAPTATGKQHQLDAIDRMMRAAGLARHIGPSEFMSMSALVKHVQNSPLSISAQDEFGAVLAKLAHPRASAHEQGISKVMRSAWGASFSTIQTPAYATASSQEIHCPSLSIYGPTTAQELYDALKGKDVANGFLNRFLVIDGGTSYDDEVEPVENLRAIPDSLSRRLASVYQMGMPTTGNMTGGCKNIAPDPSPLFVPWADDAAQEVYKRFSKDTRGRMRDDPDSAPFIARCAEIAIRCATIMACGCSMKPAVTVDHMKWGCAIAEQSACKMMQDSATYMTEALGAAEFERKLIAMLKSAPNRTMTMRDVSRRMSASQRNAYDLMATIKSLSQAEIVRESTRLGPGRPGKILTLI